MIRVSVAILSSFLPIPASAQPSRLDIEHISFTTDSLKLTSRLPGPNRTFALELTRSARTMMRIPNQRVQGMRSTKAKPKPVSAMTYEELQQALQRNLAVLSNR
jgi:hypothetical protein